MACPLETTQGNSEELPKKSANEEFLTLMSTQGVVTFDELKIFARREDLYYGFDVDIIDIALAHRDLGRVIVNLAEKTIALRDFQKESAVQNPNT